MAPNTAPVSAPRLPLTAGTCRVLIVDDSAIARAVIERMIGSDPRFEIVGSADCGAVALDVAASSAPDLVVVDYHLPDVIGSHLVRAIAHACDAAIVVVSGNAMDDIEAIRDDVLSAGAMDVMTKPSLGGNPHETARRLCARLRSAAGCRRGAEPSGACAMGGPEAGTPSRHVILRSFRKLVFSFLGRSANPRAGRHRRRRHRRMQRRIPPGEARMA